MGFRRGTGFTNLNKVITANKGNKLGSAVAGGISTQNQGVNTGIQTSQQKFEEEAQKNRLDTDEAKNKREEILGRFAPPSSTTASSGTSNVPGAAQTSTPPVTPPATPAANTSTVQPPASPAQSPVSEQEITDFTKFRAGQYSGPKELQDLATLQGKAQQTEQLGNLSRSSGGRQELLRRFVGNGQDYNQGQRRLDETLLGQDADKMRTQARATRGATGLVSQANQQAGNLAQEFQGRAQQFGQETAEQVAAAKNPWSQQLDASVAERQAKEDTRLADYASLQEALNASSMGKINPENVNTVNTKLDEAIAKGYISPQDAEFLKGSTSAGGFQSRAQGLGLDIGTLLSQGSKNIAAQNINRAGVGSSEEIARLNALDRLSGRAVPDLEFNPANTEKYVAGSANINLNPLRKGIYTKEGENAAALQQQIEAEQYAYMPTLGYEMQKTANFANFDDFNKSGLNSGNQMLAINPYDKNSWDRLKSTYTDATSRRDSSLAAQEQSRRDLASLAEGTMVSDKNLKKNVNYTDRDVQNFMDRLKPASYDYKDSVKNDPRASKDRQLGVMAQDLEKSKLGKEAVHEADIGKVVDYKDLQPKMLASLAALNQRLKKIEGGGND